MKQLKALIFSLTWMFIFSSCHIGPMLEKGVAEMKPDQKMILKEGDSLVKGTYAGLPRFDDGKVNFNELIRQLKELNVNTYNWLVWTNENDWKDLQRFLPIASENHIAVWITLVPPSESKPKTKWNSEPYGKDYVRWSREIARLSLKHRNLVAFSIDDFAHNLTTFTPEYLGEMIGAINKINPGLQFIPCCYYRDLTPKFVERYEPFLDAVLFPYRAESEKPNLQNPGLVGQEISHIKSLFTKKIPIYLDVYQTAHSRLGATTPDYVREVIRLGKEFADGVLIYVHPNPVRETEKYDIVKAGFSR